MAKRASTTPEADVSTEPRERPGSPGDDDLIVNRGTRASVEQADGEADQIETPTQEDELDEQPEQKDEPEAGPADDQPSADEQRQQRLSGLFDRMERWGNPEQPAQREPERPAKPAAGADSTAAAAPAETKLSPERQKALDALAASDKYSPDDIENFIKPRFILEQQVEDANKRLADYEGFRKTIEQRGQEYSAQAEQEAANRAGETMVKLGKGYEDVIGKIGAIDPTTGLYASSTPEQNAVLNRWLVKANGIWETAHKANDPITGDEALEVAFEYMKTKDPAFAAIRKTQADMAKRNGQMTMQPNRRGAGAGGVDKKDKYAGAKSAIRKWRDQNGVEGDDQDI